MGRRAALIGLLGAAAAVVLIILLSGGGDDEQPSTVASGTSPAPGRTEDGESGAAGSTRAQRSAAARRRARERARQRARGGRGTQRLEQGRLGAQTGGAPAQGERGETPQSGASVATINVVGGAAVGGSQRVRFKKDERVRLIVKSDTDQMVEIPEYGLTRRVQAGGSARFYFRASRQGLFEIQLQQGQTLIGVLEVG